MKRYIWCGALLVMDTTESECLKTYGELFFMFCDDIQDMDLITALQGRISLFVDNCKILKNMWKNAEKPNDN